MGARTRRILTWCTEPVALAGAFLGATVVATAPGNTGIAGLAAGWAYGKVVGFLVRLFRVPPAALPLAGLLAGPVPFALLMPPRADADSRGVIWVGLLTGLLLGLVEWAAVRRSRGELPARDPA